VAAFDLQANKQLPVALLLLANRNDLGCVWVAEFGPAAAAAAAVSPTQPAPTTSSGASRIQHATDYSSCSSSAAGVEHTATASHTLQLQSLRAAPTRIHHDWREGVRHSEPGQGSPPYVSQARTVCFEKLAAPAHEQDTAVGQRTHHA
jgi:hypothetical protein